MKELALRTEAAHMYMGNRFTFYDHRSSHSRLDEQSAQVGMEVSVSDEAVSVFNKQVCAQFATQEDVIGYRKGDHVEVVDTVNKKCACEVMEVKEDQILIHYIGWASKWDEWISTNSERIVQVSTARYHQAACAQSTLIT